MSITMYFQEWNGESGSEVATSKIDEEIQFKSADSPTVEAYESATAPVNRPNSGVNRSYEKYLQLYLEDLGDVTEISNIELFMSGEGSPSGMGVFVKVVDDYATPLAGGKSPGGAMTGEKASLYSYTSNEPLVLGVGAFDDDGESIGKFLVMQLEVYPSASEGEAPTRTMILRWDEE